MVFWLIPLLAGMAIGNTVGIISSLPPVQRSLAQWSNEMLPNAIPMPEQLVYLRMRELIDDKTYETLMKKQGFDSNWSKQIYAASQRLIDVGALITLYRRGKIDKDKYLKRMAQLGYTKEIAEDILTATEYFPTPADIVRFAVREVYTPEIVAKYQQLADLPKVYLEEAAKAGLPEEQAKNYWAAHWVLPSASQGFEMLHRGVITEDELKMLLKTLDIMPFWRDKLIKISYLPYNRVDVRRMYAAGVLDRDAVLRAYLDLGYDKEKAERMTEWTVRLYKQEKVAPERDLTKAEIIKGVNKGIITHDLGVELLMGLGYDKWEAEYILAINLAAAKGSPDTYPEFLDLVEKYKKAMGLKAVDVPKELIEVAKQITDLKQLIEKEKKKGPDREEVAALVRQLGTLETKYRLMLKKLQQP
jgi:hypothetical protein